MSIFSARANSRAASASGIGLPAAAGVIGLTTVSAMRNYPFHKPCKMFIWRSRKPRTRTNQKVSGPAPIAGGNLKLLTSAAVRIRHTTSVRSGQSLLLGRTITSPSSLLSLWGRFHLQELVHRFLELQGDVRNWFRLVRHRYSSSNLMLRIRGFRGSSSFSGVVAGCGSKTMLVCFCQG